MEVNEINKMDDGKNSKSPEISIKTMPMYVYNLMCDAVVDKYLTILDEVGFDIWAEDNIIVIRDRKSDLVPVSIKEVRQAIPYIEGVLAGSRIFNTI